MSTTVPETIAALYVAKGGATPPAFRDLLISIARSAYRNRKECEPWGTTET